jgi:tetratricopeptide (TPR) repeat protein
MGKQMLLEQERHILHVVAQALQLSSDSRLTYLEQNIGKDQLALAKAQSLLDFESRNAVLEELEPTVTLSGFELGAIVGDRFRIVRFIGSGGMGKVYEAEDLAQTSRPRVALKTIRPDIASNPRMARQFEREIEIGKTITHPNVCRIYDLGVHRASPNPKAITVFLTMELLSGRTLAQRLGGQALPPAECLPIIKQVVEALQAAHQSNVVHRDLKPSNIMLAESKAGKGLRAVVMDFGLARETFSGAVSVTSAGAGTPDYMSPEQVQGHPVGAASDIYSLGVVMYQMVTGKLPFEGEHALIRMIKRVQDPPVPPRTHVPNLPVAWENAILRCLERNPADRFANVLDLIPALGGVGANQHTKAPRRVQRKGIAILALVLCLALIAGYFSAGFGHRLLLPPDRRVAVLAFENIGGDTSNTAFCQGLMETLTSKLTQLEQFHGSLSIVPASDIRKAQVTSAGEAEKDFGVNLVITGSIERSQRGLHLIVNVVDAHELRQLRSAELFLPDNDPVAMQQGAVRLVAALLNIELKPEVLAKLGNDSTLVPGAYDFYVQGEGYLFAGNNGLDSAITEFKHALALDPNYALADAGLGQAYWQKYVQSRDRKWIDMAWSYCGRALALNPNSAPANITYAMLSSGAGKYDMAIEHARAALNIDPTNHLAYSELAKAYDAVGKVGDAEATLLSAVRLGPEYWYNHMQLGTFYYNHGRYPEAEASYRRVTELVPDNPSGYTNLGGALHMEGRDSEAEEVLKKSLQIRSTAGALSNLATVYFFEGRYADAVPLYEQLVSGKQKDYQIWGNLGDAYRWTAGNSSKAPEAYRQTIRLIKDALEVNPKDVQALSAEALYLAKLGEHDKAVTLARKSAWMAPADPDVLYDTAIVLELAGQRSLAIKYLTRSVANGYSANEVRREPELKSLRADSRYDAVMPR